MASGCYKWDPAPPPWDKEPQNPPSACPLVARRGAKWLKLLASVESTRRLSTPTRSNQLTIEYKMTNQEFDLHHVWHPYTSLTHPLPCYEVASAKGVTLTLSDGRELVDA